MEGSDLGNRESEQAVTGNAKSNYQFLISTLLTLVQMMYQNSGKSPFNTHPTIMSAFTVAAYFYTGALEAISQVTRTIPNRSAYLPIAILFCDILGPLACSLLAFILSPPIGGLLLFSCALVFIRALHGSYPQISELLRTFKLKVFSTFQQIFNLPHQADPQASHASSMEQEGNGYVPTTV